MVSASAATPALPISILSSARGEVEPGDSAQCDVTVAGRVGKKRCVTNGRVTVAILLVNIAFKPTAVLESLIVLLKRRTANSCVPLPVILVKAYLDPLAVLAEPLPLLKSATATMWPCSHAGRVVQKTEGAARGVVNRRRCCLKALPTAVFRSPALKRSVPAPTPVL